MIKLLILTVVIAVSAASLDSQWAVFKAEHGKIYNGREERYRRAVWESNLQRIKLHNVKYANGLSTFYLGENEYADMTREEFAKTMNGFQGWRMAMRSGNHEVQPSSYNVTKPLPAEVNWVTKGYVTPVKNQGQCGSCYAFSATGSLEGAHFKKTGKLVSLSEQNLMECSAGYGTHGCNWGLMDDCFRYIIDNKGIDTEASYPYHPSSGNCKFKRADVGSTQKSFHDVTRYSEPALQEAIATVGPISVAIDTDYDFQMYKGGVYDEARCTGGLLDIDHAVLVVGYGTEFGKEYYLVKNSWGATWGLHGYIKMSRNKKNQCGIATLASYPVV